MKNTQKIILASAGFGLALLSSAHAQTPVLVAGWDFNANPSYVAGTPPTGLANIASNYADSYTVPVVGTNGVLDATATAFSRGNFLTNGQGGSELLPNTSAGIQNATSNYDVTDRSISTRGLAASAVQNLGYLAGAENAISIGGSTSNAQTFAFQVDTTGVKLTEFSSYLARSNGTGSLSVAFSYQIGAAAAVAIGTYAVNTATSVYGLANFVFDAATQTALDNVGLVSILGTATYGSTQALRIENTGIFGQTTAIPEPSTYAAILASLTLGVVAMRRRKVQAGA